MWTSPDIREHVKEESDFRIGKVIEKLTIEATGKSVEEYKYVYVGDSLTYLNVPDISISFLLDKIDQVVETTKQYNMSPDMDYKSPVLAYDEYNNITFFILVLLLNKIATNANFRSDYYPNIKLLSNEQIKDILISKKQSNSYTAKEITSPEEFIEIYEEYIKNGKDPETSIDNWLNIKIPNFDFTDIQNTPAFKKLVDEIGLDKLTQYVYILSKYIKK